MKYLKIEKKNINIAFLRDFCQIKDLLGCCSHCSEVLWILVKKSEWVRILTMSVKMLISVLIFIYLLKPP